MSTLSTTAAAAATGKPSWGRLVGWGLFLAILAWSWKGAEMNPAVLFRDAGNMATFAADFFPPDFGNWKLYLSEMLVTVQIALWGTVLAIVCAIPLSILASENIVPWWVYQPVRRVMDACRSINEMVFAMLFVVAVGLGPFAGVLALFISTTGVLAKLFAEAVEAIDPVRSKASAPPVPALCRRSSSGSSRRSCRCGSPIRCTASSPTYVPPPWSGWSAPAASA